MAEVLVGRDPELQLLETLLGTARVGGACLLVILLQSSELPAAERDALSSAPDAAAAGARLR
jgi:hypothetical protein